MKKILSLLAIVVAICSCSTKEFQVKGTITDAKDSLLLFEHMTLDGPVVIDSLRLDETGDFSFSAVNPTEADSVWAPEFYRLRIAGNIINVAIDSTETVTFKAKFPVMSSDYTVEGSDDCQRIKELSVMQQQLLSRCIAVDRAYGISMQETKDSIQALMEQYKNVVRQDYIFKAPQAASSYFALFQTLGQMLIFNPQESEMDARTFAAVATAWDTYYTPSSVRAQNLHNIAIEGINALRAKYARENAAGLDPDKVQVVTLFDVPLIDNHGKRRSLTEFKGQVVLLDFHAFGMPQSTERIMMLRDLYNKYHAAGLEIYQVSVDDNEHFWKTQTAALPWVSVFDPDGVQSEYLQRYNVQQIPTFFLIDRTNTLSQRDTQIKDLDQAIQKLL